MRYTVSGATGTSQTDYNRIDNLLIQSGATAPPAQNAATLPQPGDIVIGLNNTDANNSFEIVRGATAPNNGVRYPAAVWQFNNTSLPTPAVQNVSFIEYNQFDNLSGVSHNAYGNLIAVDFGTTTAGTGGGKIYSLATQGPNPTGAGIANAQIIGNTNTQSASINALGQSGAGACAGTGACLTGVTQTRLSGPSISPDNTKIAFTKRVDLASGRRIMRLSVLDLQTLVEQPLAETRNVDEQVEWLDNSQVLYSLPDEASAARRNIWVVQANRGGNPNPRRFAKNASSPAAGRNGSGL